MTTRKKYPLNNSLDSKILSSLAEPIVKLRSPSANEMVYNYAFVVYGMGCNTVIRQKRARTEKNAKSNIMYNGIYTKCYEKQEVSCFGKMSSVIPTLADRLFNPFNVPHKNFEEEIQDSYSSIPDSLKSQQDVETGPNSVVDKMLTRLTSPQTESLLSKVLKRLQKNKSGKKEVNVYLFGHSYGSLIINRLCQELQKIADKDIAFKEIIKTHVKAFALNSIMVVDPHTIMDVDLVNWMDIGDVALKLNALELAHHKPILELDTFIHKQPSMKIAYMYQKETNVVWYTNYTTQTDDNGKKTIQLIPPDSAYSLFGSRDEWSRHNKNTYSIMNLFLTTGDNMFGIDKVK